MPPPPRRVLATWVMPMTNRNTSSASFMGVGSFMRFVKGWGRSSPTVRPTNSGSLLHSTIPVMLVSGGDGAERSAVPFLLCRPPGSRRRTVIPEQPPRSQALGLRL